MSPYERIKNMTLDEMADWFNTRFKNFYDEAPWDIYLFRTFCEHCPTVMDIHGHEYAYCEFEKCCPEGQRNVYNIDSLELIKLWLAGEK